jgi:hypothetical protein
MKINVALRSVKKKMKIYLELMNTKMPCRGKPDRAASFSSHFQPFLSLFP